MCLTISTGLAKAHAHAHAKKWHVGEKMLSNGVPFDMLFFSISSIHAIFGLRNGVCHFCHIIIPLTFLIYFSSSLHPTTTIQPIY